MSKATIASVKPRRCWYWTDDGTGKWRPAIFEHWGVSSPGGDIQTVALVIDLESGVVRVLDPSDVCFAEKSP